MRGPTHRILRASAYCFALTVVAVGTVLQASTTVVAATHDRSAVAAWSLSTMSTIGGGAVAAILAATFAYAILRRRWRQADRNSTQHWDNNALSTALWAGKNDLLDRRVTSAEQSAQWCADYERWRQDVDRLLERGYTDAERDTFSKPAAHMNRSPIDPYDVAHEQRRNVLAAQIESLRFILMHRPS